jgi:hypothetical protein
MPSLRWVTGPKWTDDGRVAEGRRRMEQIE